MDIRPYWTRLTRFLSTVVRNIVNDQVFSRSASLAFTSLLALVPVTMVVFSFGGFDQLGVRFIESLSRFLLPEGGDRMLEIFETFTLNARRLGTWGSLLFLLTAAFLLNAMENHLNMVLRARSRRGTLRRLATYIASLALISFLFGAGFGPISGMLDAWNRFPPPGQRMFGIILSFLGAVTGMMLLFSLVSSARIRFRSALLGSFIGALGFQAAKIGFTFWTTHSVRQSIIYGSVVFLPLLLIWLNVAWLIVMVAAEITYAHQIGAGRRVPLEHGSQAAETETGWALYLMLNEDFRRGLKPPGIKDLSRRLGVDERRVDDILKRLEKGRLVYQISGHPAGYVPAVAPSDLSAARVFAVVTGWNDAETVADPDGAPALLRRGLNASLGERTVRSFLGDEDDVSPG